MNTRKTMTLHEIITEYSKSCGNAPADKPWECEECHEAAQRALKRNGHKGDIKELYLASKATSPFKNLHYPCSILVTTLPELEGGWLHDEGPYTETEVKLVTRMKEIFVEDEEDLKSELAYAKRKLCADAVMVMVPIPPATIEDLMEAVRLDSKQWAAHMQADMKHRFDDFLAEMQQHSQIAG